MKLAVELTGPNGKMWELAMQYHKLPPAYAMEIASVARAYAEYVKNTAGNAASGDPQYAIAFKYDADASGPKIPQPGFEELFHGTAEASNLLYSQAVAMQDAGILLLQKLQDGAHMEIASGQRK